MLSEAIKKLKQAVQKFYLRCLIMEKNPLLLCVQ